MRLLGRAPEDLRIPMGWLAIAVAVMSICTRSVTTQDQVYPKAEAKVGKAPVVVPIPIFMQLLVMHLRVLRVIPKVDNPLILSQ